MLTSKIITEIIENHFEFSGCANSCKFLFQFNPDKQCNYLRCCCDKGTSAHVAPLLKGQGGNAPVMPLLFGVPGLRATQQNSLRWSRCRCHTQELSNGSLQIREMLYVFTKPKAGVCNPWAAGQK